ncbi:MAG: hypothetical protein CVU13_00090 [Bacteroidetes bacterium HGW-Bacteroidetes-8]|jgi:hypothetical protein|nr:MAG: hypothetical protein CVU13_00090 [Bacteroidetes bacterium HGW-Bacteroidetes-8]
MKTIFFICRQILPTFVLLLTLAAPVYTQGVTNRDTLSLAKEIAYIGEFGKAAKLLADFNSRNATPESLEFLAWVEHWRGREQSAIKNLKLIPGWDSGNSSVRILLDEIKAFRSPIIESSYEFNSDDQPMSLSNYHIKGNIYRSWLFSPGASLRYLSYNSSYGNGTSDYLWYEASNRIGLNSAKIIFELKAGGLTSYFGDKREFTWRVMVSKQLFKKITLELSAGRTPYLYTLKSVYHSEEPLMNNFVTGALKFNSKDNYRAELSYISNNFGKDERVYTTYFWLLAPILKSDYLRLDAGYSFNFSNSTSSTFKPASDINENITPSVGLQFKGMYDPYFSPINQYINSAVISATIKGGKLLSISTKLVYGFVAWSDNPTLWEQSVNSISTYQTYFSKLKFSPVEFEAKADLKLSDKITLSAFYIYNNLAFYKLNKANFSIKYVL